MVDLHLGADEGILLESECATWITNERIRLQSLILTNKSLYYVYEKSNGMFVKPTLEITEKPLSDIKIINNQPLVERIKNTNGSYLQIQFTESRDRFYFSERTTRTTDIWVNEICKLLTGCDAPTKQNEIASEAMAAISGAKGAFSGLASGLRKAADSAIQTASDSAKQYVESDAAAKHKESIAGAVGALSGFAASVKNAADEAVHDAVDQYHDYIEDKKVADDQFRQMFTGSENEGNSIERQQEYAGVVLKCPSCGAPISQTTVICPDCGHRITGQAAVSSVKKFSDQLMLLEARRKKDSLGQVFGASANPTDKQKLALIQSFAIPNTIDDIQEFILLAVANIDTALSKDSLSNRQARKMKGSLNSNITMPRELSDAWVSKMQQAYQKARISFPDDPVFEHIKQIYAEKMKELKMPVE